MTQLCGKDVWENLGTCSPGCSLSSSSSPFSSSYSSLFSCYAPQNIYNLWQRNGSHRSLAFINLTMLAFFACRGFPVLGDPICLAPGHRLFPHTSLRSEYFDRYPVVGLLLDQHRSDSSSRIARPAHRAHDDHAEFWCSHHAASRVIHQSHRRLDVNLPRLRLYFAPGVRLCKCRLQEWRQEAGH